MLHPVADRAIRVLIVDDHPVVRDGVIAGLRTREGIEVVGGGATGSEAVELARRLRPDVVVIDLHMPGGGGVDAIRGCARAGPDSRCVVLTMDDEDDALFAAMQAGASGYLLKGSRGGSRAGHRRCGSRRDGVRFGGLATCGLVVPGGASARRSGLLPGAQWARELTLLDLLAAGEDNAAIGRHLGLAPKTVRNQISLLLTKLGVADRVAAVLLARQAGLGRTAFGP